jgi:hypothetical protein
MNKEGDPMRAKLIVIGVVLATMPAHALVLCMKRSGNLAVRDACKPREAAVDPVALGLQGPPGPQGPSGASAPAFVAKDANGQLVGTTLLFHGGGFTLMRTVNGQPVVFVVTSNGFDEQNDPGLAFITIYYDGPACAGQGYVPSALGPAPWFFPVVRARHGIAYYSTGTGELRTYASRLDISATEQGCVSGAGGTFIPPESCCIPESGTTTGRIVATVPLASFGLVPPFHVEAP